MDDYTRDFAKRIVRELGELNGKLNRLIGLADRPEQDDEHSIGPHEKSQKQDYAAITKLLLALQSQPSPTNKNKSDKSWYKTLAGWKVLFEIIGICSAILYAGISYRQWQDAGTNFKLQQRPWVGPEFPSRMKDDPVISGVAANQPFRWDYVMKNYGNSPALRARGHARAYVLTAGFGDWGFIRRNIETLELLPNSENTIFNGTEIPDSGVSDRLLPEQDFIDLQNGKTLIVLGGRIEYFDEAGSLHNTTWCMVYLPDPVGTPHVSRWHSCPINPIAD